MSGSINTSGPVSVDEVSSLKPKKVENNTNNGPLNKSAEVESAVGPQDRLETSKSKRLHLVSADSDDDLPPLISPKISTDLITNSDLKTEKVSENEKEVVKEAARVFSCPICHQQFPSRSFLRDHVTFTHGTYGYRCDQCNYNTASAGLLKRHKISHTGESPYVCSVCGFRAGNSRSVKAHEEIHQIEGHSKCDECKAIFANENGLLRHKAYAHPVDGAKLESDPESDDDLEAISSGASSPLKSSVKGNKTDEVLYKCPLCLFIGKNSYILRMHLRAHESQVAFRCTECHALFDKDKGLRKHLALAHSDPNESKDMKNNEKEKGLTESSSKKRSSRGKSKQIEMVHLTEYRNFDGVFQCPLCPYSIPIRGSFQIHLRAHQSDNPIPCPECDAIFQTQRGLLSHTFQTHGDGSNSDRNGDSENSNDSDEDESVDDFDSEEESSDDSESSDSSDEVKLIDVAQSDDDESESKDDYRLPKHLARREREERKREEARRGSSSSFTMPTRLRKFPHVELNNISIYRHGDKLRCPVCAYFVRSEGTFRIHLRNHDLDRPIPCDQCKAIFASEKGLVKHTSLAHIRKDASEHSNSNNNVEESSEESDSEESSSEKAKSKRTLRKYPEISLNHILKYRKPDGSTFICPICGFEAKYRFGFVTHLRAHDLKDPIACGSCKALFAAEVGLAVHMAKVHLKSDPSPSPTKAVEESPLSQPVEKIEIETNAPISSKYAPLKKFPDIDLNSNFRKDRSETPFECPLCQYRSRYAVALRRHIQVHDLDVYFSCEHCKAIFDTEPGAKRHVIQAHPTLNISPPFASENAERMDTYLQIEPNSEKMESSSSELLSISLENEIEDDSDVRSKDRESDEEGELSQLSASGAEGLNPDDSANRPFKCLYCPKSFLESRYLEYHVNAHFDLRPFKCDQCDYAAHMPSTLRVHKRTHLK